ncbi:MAG: DUF1501 domain-containing protein [Verrucomicrobiota bacterium]
MNPIDPLMQRRAFLSATGLGVGALAMNHLLTPELFATPPHHAPKAKRVIFFHMVGAPSQLDLFDYKPVLQKHDRRPAPDSFFKGKRFSFLRGQPKLLGTPFQFKQHGQAGTWISELLPHLSRKADDLAVIRSMRTPEFNHAPAQMIFHTGQNRQGGYPSAGSWVDYGLGSENRNLPGYVVFLSGNTPGAGRNLWNNGFLPSIHQGVRFRSKGEPVLFLEDPPGVDQVRRRRVLDSIRSLNEARFSATHDPEIETRIRQYEMAFRMQTSVPELMDLSSEPASVLKAYGDTDFARQCLYARRLAESGVRFIELFHADWDTHGNQEKRLRSLCQAIDQPIAALIDDLKNRGMLNETLVVWGAEFGRTPMLQGNEAPSKCGRDHHRDAYTIWMAGGGVRAGTNYGATDEMGYHVAEDPVEARDFHATLLHLLGLDHEQVLFRYQGLDQKLTGVEKARVLNDLVS